MSVYPFSLYLSFFFLDFLSILPIEVFVHPPVTHSLSVVVYAQTDGPHLHDRCWIAHGADCILVAGVWFTLINDSAAHTV